MSDAARSLWRILRPVVWTWPELRSVRRFHRLTLDELEAIHADLTEGHPDRPALQHRMHTLWRCGP